MKKLKSLLVGTVAVVAALTMSLAVVGCSGGGGGSAEDKAVFVGEWTLESMDDNGDVITADDLSLIGMEVLMTFNEDGTGSIDLMGEQMDFNWDAKSATEAVIKSGLAGNDTMTLADGKLSVEVEGTKMVFVKK